MTPSGEYSRSDPDDPRPFAGEAWCASVLPDLPDDPWASLAGLAALLMAERAELEAELGCTVRWVAPADAARATARCLIGPSDLNPAFAEAGIEAATGPVVVIDRGRGLVAIDGPDVGAVGSAFQLLRTAVRSGQLLTTPRLPDSPEQIVDLLTEEAWQTYPSFALRDLDWPAIADRHREAVLAEDASLASMQRWFAELQDAHSWVKDSRVNARLPYHAWIDRKQAWLTSVPRWSAAWTAGVRPGDTLLDVDHSEWWERTGATPRLRSMVTGYRWLSGMVGTTRSMRAVGSDGTVRLWDERYEPLPWPEPLSWRVLPSGTGYLRIRGWLMTKAWFDLVESAFQDLNDCPRLLVDLRGNVGGSLVAAQRFRDRFLDGETLLGSVQFSIGSGRLGNRSPLMGLPPPAGRWRKPARFLIDRSTYSASEDAVLGLGGLPGVQVVGEPSGGGSGRPRTIDLPGGLFATVSTALTFDRSGHCIEANGLAVDVALPIDEHLRDPRRISAREMLARADDAW